MFFGASHSASHRAGKPALSGVQGTSLTGSGKRHSSDCRAQGSSGPGQWSSSERHQPVLNLVRIAVPQRDRATGVLRSPVRSSRRDGCLRGRTAELFGATRVRPRGPRSHHRDRSPELFGAQASALGRGRERSSHWETGLPRPSGQGISATHGKVSAGVRVTTSVEAWSVRTPAPAGDQAGQDGNDRRATVAVMRYGC